MDQFDWVSTSRQIRASGHDAFQALFRHVYPGLVAYARFWLKQDTDVKDVVQEVMIRLWQHRERLDEQRSLQALLYASVRNQAFNRIRDQRPMLPLHDPALNLETTLAALENGHANGAELENLLHQWLEKLPERQREAFWLSRFEDLRYRDIAEVMGITPKTVENHIHEALRFLRDQVRAYDPELMPGKQSGPGKGG